jgi:hypothetical protein
MGNTTDKIYVIQMEDGNFYVDGGLNGDDGLLIATRLHKAKFMDGDTAHDLVSKLIKNGNRAVVGVCKM